MKPFQTYRQQIRILRARGLSITGERAIKILERENYYNVVNGYKNLFLKVDQEGKFIEPEEYIDGASFDEIYKLYLFDRELRNILLKYLLQFENSIKTKLSYRFSEKFKKPHAYLQMHNYSNKPDQLERILKLIATLSTLISKNSDRNNSLKHYLDNHGGIPLWVLVGYLTIGNISNFYMVLDDSLKDLIAKDFSKEFKKSYNQQLQISSATLEDVLKAANLFRNVCAHEERMYNFKLYKAPRSRHNSNLLSIPTSHLEGTVFTMVAFLKLVLPKRDHKELLINLRNLFLKYQANFNSIPFGQVLMKMGFPQEWESYF